MPISFHVATGMHDMTTKNSFTIGKVIGGNLNTGLIVRVDENIAIEELTSGNYFKIIGRDGYVFYGIAENIKLSDMDKKIYRRVNTIPLDMLNFYRGTSVYGLLTIKPILMETPMGEIKNTTSIPSHFSSVEIAGQDDIKRIFSNNSDCAYKIGNLIGNPDLNIYIDLKKITERSTAVFGKSGSGKTFFVLPLIAEIISRKVCSVLIFDMHNDYAYVLKGDKENYKGLKNLEKCSDKVKVISLDPMFSKRINHVPDAYLNIFYDQILPEDIEPLSSLIALTDVQINTIYSLYRNLESSWFPHIIVDNPSPEINKLLSTRKLSDATYHALNRNLSRFGQYKFITSRWGFELADNEKTTSIEEICNDLARGYSIVIEFGRYSNDLLAYLFVSNFISRRIHQKYVQLKELYEGGTSAEPKPLIIVVEEAHKFLEKDIADYTVFGTIAREMRKYNVTLLLIDQRPSSIDDEVMSQISTRIVYSLTDENDINAVLTGTADSNYMKNIITSLSTKKQAVIFGYAVPAPLPIDVVEYNEKIVDYSLSYSA
ncbi:MAG: ATP-binding protein [Methylacidiphilales bacterium]|nr:ATP-binding protein [Candidatus Methylacidiphilales bacterium]